MALANRSSLTRSKTPIDKLPIDLVAQIFLRIPSHPSCILHVSAVCSDWRKLIRSNDFRALTLSHNGGTPLLGFFTNSSEDRRFITEHDFDTTTLRQFAFPGTYSVKIYVLACRDGWVLLHSGRFRGWLLAWHPIMNIVTDIGKPLIWQRGKCDNGTIFCSSTQPTNF